jgi:post-segregation antitoxin (ccd killing protein)
MRCYETRCSSFDQKIECAYYMHAHRKLQEETPMLPLYDRHAPRKATNLSINSDRLNNTKELDINLSATLE